MQTGVFASYLWAAVCPGRWLSCPLGMGRDPSFSFSSGARSGLQPRQKAPRSRLGAHAPLGRCGVGPVVGCEGGGGREEEREKAREAGKDGTVRREGKGGPRWREGLEKLVWRLSGQEKAGRQAGEGEERRRAAAIGCWRRDHAAQQGERASEEVCVCVCVCAGGGRTPAVEAGPLRACLALPSRRPPLLPYRCDPLPSVPPGPRRGGAPHLPRGGGGSPAPRQTPRDGGRGEREPARPGAHVPDLETEAGGRRRRRPPAPPTSAQTGASGFFGPRPAFQTEGARRRSSRPSGKQTGRVNSWGQTGGPDCSNPVGGRSLLGSGWLVGEEKNRELVGRAAGSPFPTHSTPSSRPGAVRSL